MIFTGDISLPYANSIKIKNAPEFLFKKRWFSNLEGAIVDNSDKLKDQWIVYNDREAIKSLIKDFNFAGFGLANNHVFDAGSYQNTIDFLDEQNIPCTGIGKNISNSALPLIDNDNNIQILNYGWEVIQCEISSKNKFGVNPLVREHVIKSFNDAKRNNPNLPIVVFFHWNYELEAYPHPFERELARYLIDNGAVGIIGCHPHRVGGFEVYNGKPIVYSLGNWMFMQEFYHRGKIKFPDFCNLELAFEWDFETSELFFHFFEYDKLKSELSFLRTEDVESKTMNDLTPFRNMDNEEYKKWYKLNRFHKDKGLPIYYFEDSIGTIKFKNYLNRLRDKLIFIVVKIGLK